MTLLEPDIGEPLTFEEVKRLVEAASPAIELQLDEGGKGRFLVARKALKAGEVLLSEQTLFCGRTDARQTRLACKKEFADIATDVIKEGRDAEYQDDDCIHPCSPLIDCLAGILHTKSEALHSKDKSQRARSKLKIRQFATLARSSVAAEPMTDEDTKELLDAFSPEFVGTMDKDGLEGALRAISCNRFGGIEGQLDIMFAGSMFEHSCDPNCFAGNWRRLAHQPRIYRALRDIEAGEALSISYIELADLYLPTAARAKVLNSWGFRCACPLCTCRPELSRAFVCPACSLPELCPTTPGLDAPELRCRKCGKSAEPAYGARCFELEGVLTRLSEGVEEPFPHGGADANGSNDNVIGCFHHAAFRMAWQTMQEGPSLENLSNYATAIEDLIQCITRFHGVTSHPDLLEMYHIMAELNAGNLEGQQHYLELERATLTCYYAEEAEKQDQEILNLCQGRGPHTAPDVSTCTDTDLDGMD